MDTLYSNSEKFNLKKLTETIINVSIIGILVLCQGLVPIHADSVKIAGVTAPDFDIKNVREKISSEFYLEKRVENFDKLIYSKYKDATIYNIRNGINTLKLLNFTITNLSKLT